MEDGRGSTLPLHEPVPGIGKEPIDRFRANGVLGLRPSFEVFDAMGEMVVGAADEGIQVGKLAVEVLPVLRMLELDLPGERF